jgi:hypothetical protein
VCGLGWLVSPRPSSTRQMSTVPGSLDDFG